MAGEAFPGEEDALVRSWLGGLMTRGLCLPEGLTVEQAAREREGARGAAAALAGELSGDPEDGGAGLEAQVQAAQFVSAHAAAMDWQAEANRRDLPPHARATAQRLARQLMALTTAQLHALRRLRAERRKDREAAQRRAERETARRIQARAADTRAMIAGFEHTLKDLARAERGALEGGPAADLAGDLDADFAGELEPDFAGDFASGPPEPAGPRPVGAGPGFAGGCAEASVPEPPPDPAPPLNRQQRRALARQRRRDKRAGAEEGGKGLGVAVGSGEAGILPGQ